MNPRDYAVAAAVRTAYAFMAEAKAAAETMSALLAIDCAVWFAKGIPARRLSDVQVPDRYIVGAWLPELEHNPPGGAVLVCKTSAPATQNNISNGGSCQ